MKRSNLKAIVYYDCLDYPLTKGELEIFSFKDKESGEANLFEEAGGFYFLKGRRGLIEIRKKRNKIAEKKWKKALRAVKLLRLIPYIRLAFASGSLALSNTDKESDLDILVVVKSGRIWTARSLAVFLLNLLGLLRRRGEILAADKVCLNHFIIDKSPYIPRKSIYTAQLYARLVPILWNNDKLIREFCEANSWIGEWVNGWPECVLENNKKRIENSRFLGFVKKIGEKILDTKLGDWLEAVFRKYNLHRIKNYYLTYKPGGRVKADDESLEFHPDSPELKIIEKYNRTMEELGFSKLGKERDSGLLTRTES